jgi:hypothetical protein
MIAALGFALVAAGLVLGPAGSASAASCEVGDPSAHEPSADNVVSEMLVIGCGQALGGPVEIAAYRVEDVLAEETRLCVQVHHPGIEVSGFASCPHGPPQNGEAIEYRHGGLLHPGDVTDAVADLTYRVKKVKTRFIGPGGSRSGDTVLARVHAGLAAKLGEPAPFGYVISFARGCAYDDVRMKALGRRDKVLGTADGGVPGCPN